MIDYEATGPNYAVDKLRALWVLEMAIRHPTRPFGASYEDLLLEDQSFAS